MDTLKQQLTTLAQANRIDEIRFIDCGELEPTFAFKGRQPLDVMPEGKSIIVTSVYIGNFNLPGFDPKRHARTSRLTLSGFYANIVNPIKPLRDFLIEQGYKAHICDGYDEEQVWHVHEMQGCLPCSCAGSADGAKPSKVHF